MSSYHAIYHFVRSLPLGDWVTDAWYTIKRYRRTFGHWPNLVRPKTFNEQINRKKLFDRNPLLTRLADKYEVRQYVQEKIGKDYLTKLYLVAEYPGEIDFALLPDSFVVKATHGSGWNIFVRRKSEVQQREVLLQCADWLQRDYYELGREWCYKNIKPRIIIEEYLSDRDGQVPYDYKIFCFGGTPQFVQVDIDRFTDHRRNLYDLHWNKLGMRLSRYDNFNFPLSAPKNLDAMLSLAGTLAAGLDFVRIDLYSVREKIYFGEMTHYHGNGFEKFDPQAYDALFGAFWP